MRAQGARRAHPGPLALFVVPRKQAALDEPAERAIAAGHDLDRVLGINDLVTSDNTYFVATGVTDGQLVDGVRKSGPNIRTESIILRGRSGTVRRVVAEHLSDKWL